MLTEWEGPAVVIGARPYGESGLVVTLMTEALGRHPGMARGGQSRAQAPLWQPGNLVEARWVARLSYQLGAVTGEMVHAAAALAMDDPLALAVLTAACAVAEGALPERQPHPATFQGLVGLVVALARDPHRGLEALIRWEAALLAELGYGLDLTSCAATGVTDGSMLRGVRMSKGKASTHSLVMRSRTGTVRYVEAHHDLTRKSF